MKKTKNNRSKIIRALQVGTLILAVTCNFALGQLSAIHSIASQTEISLEPDTRPLAPTVQIDGIRNGNLEGHVLGGSRFLLGEEIVLPDTEGKFSIDTANFLRNEVSIVVPSGARFVASERGKYYYPVISSKGNALSPNTRVYFSTEAEARAAGYLPPS